jgi:hypothetical protein
MRTGAERRRREELVDTLLNWAWVVDSKLPARLRKPGQVIAALRPEVRKELSTLTAADFQRRDV